MNGGGIQNQATSGKQQIMPTANKDLRRQQKFRNLLQEKVSRRRSELHLSWRQYLII